jgi:hypothetical protein
MRIQDIIGRALGLALAPFSFIGSAIRRDRLFHPDGVIYRAEVKPLVKEGLLKPLSERLAGGALVRLSGAIWKWPEGSRRPDLLGIAVRFRGKKQVTPQLLPGDQDITFVTASSVLGLVTAALATDSGDFLDNRYHTILPFHLEGVGRVYLRLVPVQSSPSAPDRHQRLALAVAQHKAVLQLEILATELGDSWIGLATIELRERMLIDDEALVFFPGSSGMGLRPLGVLQALRPEIYTASQAGWRLTRR